MEGGMEINLNKIKENDIIKILFAENPGIVIQVKDKDKAEVKKILEDAGIGYVKLGTHRRTPYSSNQRRCHLPIRY